MSLFIKASRHHESGIGFVKNNGILLSTSNRFPSEHSFHSAHLTHRLIPGRSWSRALLPRSLPLSHDSTLEPILRAVEPAVRLIPERYLRQVLHYLIDWGHALPTNLDEPFWVSRGRSRWRARLLPEHLLTGTEPCLLLITDPDDRMLEQLPIGLQLRAYWRRPLFARPCCAKSIASSKRERSPKRVAWSGWSCLGSSRRPRNTVRPSGRTSALRPPRTPHCVIEHSPRHTSILSRLRVRSPEHYFPSLAGR